MNDTQPDKPVNTGIMDNVGIHMSRHSSKSENAGIMDNVGIHMSGHIMIRDKETGEELVNKRT
jgi:hypothetical protein